MAARESVARLPISREGAEAADASAAAASILRGISNLLPPGDTIGEVQEVESQAGKDPGLAAYARTLAGLRLGRFVVEDYLGHGGFGVVFRAHDTELDRDVALKFPRPERLGDPELKARIFHEARAAARLRHPGIVQVYDVGSIGPAVYIASELCEGGTLHDWLAENPQRLPPRTAARLVMELADAIGFAHTRGVIHLDLKPANIVVEEPPSGTTDNQPLLRVTDFGLSGRVSETGRLDAELLGGTRRYMAPEQIAGDAERIAAATDVYALGVILRELHSKEVPLDLRSISARCLHEEPARRYRDGIELRDDLQRFLNGRPVEARPIGTIQTAVYWVKRRPVLASTAIAISTCIAAATIAIHAMYLEERQLRTEAETRRGEARRAVDEMYTQVAEKLLAGDGSLDGLQEEFLLKALAHYQRWAEEDQDDPVRRHEASVAWHRVANMQSRLGNAREGAIARRKCLEIVEELLQRDPKNKTFRYDHFYNLMVFATESRFLPEQYDQSARNRICLQAHREIAALAATEPSNVVYLDALAASARTAGAALVAVGRFQEGWETFCSGLKAGRELVAAHPENLTYTANVAQTLRQLCRYAKSSDLGLKYGGEATSMFRELVAAIPNEPTFRQLLGDELFWAARWHVMRKEFSPARLRFHEAIDVHDALCRDFPERLYYVADRATIYFELGCVEHREGNEAQAETLISRAIRDLTGIINEDEDLALTHSAVLERFKTTSPLAKPLVSAESPCQAESRTAIRTTP
jgi:serine/threonine protein kinase